MRKLASIQKISELSPIKGADLIEIATVLGWQCVVKKGEFKEGDLIIYFEVDSILPQTPDFEFMATRKYRVKTIRLRKQISQGLVASVNILKNYKFKGKIKEGLDVTEIIGVEKYDPFAERDLNIKLNKKKSKLLKYLLRYNSFKYIYRLFFKPKTLPFPDFVNKTDEPRIQSFGNDYVNSFKGKLFRVTEKIDGQSATYAIYKNKFYVCSRNNHLVLEDTSNWWKIAKKYDIENILKYIGLNIAIQGEIVGPGIQGNKYQLKELDFFVFKAYDIDTEEYLTIPELISICNAYGFNMVPVLDIVNFEDRQSLIKMSKGKSKLNKTTEREGIVLSSRLRNIHFKVINPNFLLKFDE